MDLARARASAYERLRSVGAFRGDDATRRATRDADDAIEWIQKSFRQLETLSDDDDEEEEDDGRAVRRASNASRVARFALVFWYESVRVRKGARRARRVCVLRGVRALGWGHDGEREARSEGESVGWRRRRISRRRRVLAIQS